MATPSRRVPGDGRHPAVPHVLLDQGRLRSAAQDGPGASTDHARGLPPVGRSTSVGGRRAAVGSPPGSCGVRRDPVGPAVGSGGRGPGLESGDGLGVRHFGSAVSGTGKLGSEARLRRPRRGSSAVDRGPSLPLLAEGPPPRRPEWRHAGCPRRCGRRRTPMHRRHRSPRSGMEGPPSVRATHSRATRKADVGRMPPDGRVPDRAVRGLETSATCESEPDGVSGMRSPGASNDIVDTGRCRRSTHVRPRPFRADEEGCRSGHPPRDISPAAFSPTGRVLRGTRSVREAPTG